MTIDNGPETHNQDQAFRQAVWKVYGFQQHPVDDMHRLISPGDGAAKEFISDKLGTRVIVMPAHSEAAALHTRLAEARLPVFSVIGSDELLALLVPEGAQPMSSILPAIAREPHKYGALFKDTGRLLRRLSDAGFGVPEVDQDTLLFDRLGFATSEETASGVELYLVPPYRFDKSVTQEDLLDYVGAELTSSNLFNIVEVHYLTDQVDQGWDEAAN